MKHEKLIILGGMLLLLIFSLGIVTAHENTTDVVCEDSAVLSDGILSDDYNSEIIVEDVTQEFLSEDEFRIEIYDLEGNPIDDANPIISFDSKHEFDDLSYNVGDGEYYFQNFYYLDVGTHKVKFKLDDGVYKAKTAIMNVKITKAPVQLKLKKYLTTTKEYSVLKARAYSHGNVIYYGTVTFKINGKSYTVKINQNNGYATKKIKLTKAKTYKYTATFKCKGFKTKSASSNVHVKPYKKYYTFKAKNYKHYQTTGKLTYNLPYKQYLKLLNSVNNGKHCQLIFKSNVKVKGVKWFKTQCDFYLEKNGKLQFNYEVVYDLYPTFASKYYDLYKTI